MIYPYSRGLIASMMIRFDHGVFIGKTPSFVLKIYLLMQHKYDELARNGLVEVPGEPHYGDKQLYEEITGEGFYSPEKEHTYVEFLTSYLKQVDHIRPIAPEQPYLYMVEETARHKLGNPEWCYKTSTSAGDDFILEGGVPRTLTRGPNKGSRSFKGVQLNTIVVTREELDNFEEEWSRRTGYCKDCQGRGEQFQNICGTCGGSGIRETEKIPSSG